MHFIWTPNPHEIWMVSWVWSICHLCKIDVTESGYIARVWMSKQLPVISDWSLLVISPLHICEFPYVKKENKTWKREHLFKHFILCSSILKRIAVFQKFCEKVVQEVIFALDQCRISNYASLKQYCAIFFFWRQTVNSFRVRCCFVH